MKDEYRLTQQGRVTVPAHVRAHLGIKPGDLVEFTLRADDQVKMTPFALAPEHESKTTSSQPPSEPKEPSDGAD